MESNRGGTSQGKPVLIMKPRKDEGFDLDLDALKRILLANDVKDKPVVVVSIVGAFRQGKSFLMNYLLRYMHNHNRGKYWLGDPNEPLEGFEWRGGSSSVTAGIQVWDKVFHVTTSKGSELAVLFMDTQGTFDCKSTRRESTTLFAMSTLVSSVQIYNLLRNIQEDDLENLQIFSEYGRLAMENTTTKPFQKLLFLVRDWSSPDDYAYGEEGGTKFINYRLRTTGQRNSQLTAVREHITSCFSEIGCFLMPYPGEKVATLKTFHGRVSDISGGFLDHLKELVPSLLEPDHLLVKCINGETITCKELVNLFEVYANMLKSDKLPVPKNLFEVTADICNQRCMQEAKDNYNSAMEKIVDPEKPFLRPDDFKKTHDKAKKSALELFETTPKMGGDTLSRPYLEKTKKEIEERFSIYKKTNSAKQSPIDKAMIGTGATALACCLAAIPAAFFPPLCLGLGALASASAITCGSLAIAASEERKESKDISDCMQTESET